MLKKVWFMFVLWSALMVSGCSGGMQKENKNSGVISEAVITEMDVPEVEEDVSLEAFLQPLSVQWDSRQADMWLFLS